MQRMLRRLRLDGCLLLFSADGLLRQRLVLPYHLRLWLSAFKCDLFANSRLDNGKTDV